MKLINKAKLLADGGELACSLARSGNQDFANSKYAYDYDIISQKDGAVAATLALTSGKTGWIVFDRKTLALMDGMVAFWIYDNHENCKDHKDILELRNHYIKKHLP